MKRKNMLLQTVFVLGAMSTIRTLKFGFLATLHFHVTFKMMFVFVSVATRGTRVGFRL